MRLSELINDVGSSLQQFLTMSHSVGQRPDYTQGGGGNTSVKLKNGLMAVKASGMHLSNLSLSDGYSIVDYSALRNEIINCDDFQVRPLKVNGLPNREPSIEVGFHSLLGKFVLHTHSVYSNFVSCCKNGRQIAKKIAEELRMKILFIEYCDPGNDLAFAVKSSIKTLSKKVLVEPIAIFLENHGIVVSCNNYEECINLHEQINKLCASLFDVQMSSFPEIKLEEHNDILISNTNYLREKLTNPKYGKEFFVEEAVLFPYQRVYFKNNHYKICADTRTVFYSCSRHQAATIEETLCSVLFMYEAITGSGQQVKVLSENEKAFADSLLK
jgi:rhamnose utilization protein RhaD (predicted bifunctional aldolase and dehydrogenase)